MPNPMVAMAATSAVGTAGSLIQGNKANKAAQGAAGDTREAAAAAEALNRERYGYAQNLMQPSIGRSDIASSQIMAELGLPQYQTPTPAASFAKPMQRPGVYMPSQPITANQFAKTAPSQPEFIRQYRGKGNYINVPNPEYVAPTNQALGQGPQGSQGYQGSAYGSAPIDYAPGHEFKARESYAPAGINDPQMDRPDYAQMMRQEQFSGRQMPVESAALDYQNLPGYQDLMSEQQKAVQQQAASGGGTAYGGRRLEEAGKVGGAMQRSFYENEMSRRERESGREQNAYENYIGRDSARDVNIARMQQADYGNQMNRQQSYYNNYMNMLQNMASPTSATNMASMGLNQGITQGNQNMQATAQANQSMMQGQAAQGAAIADVAGGAANLMSSAMQSGMFNKPPVTQDMSATGGMSGYMV